VHVVEDIAGVCNVGSGLEVEGTAVVTESWEGDTVRFVRIKPSSIRLKLELTM
jgi:hypothetical protein